MAIQLTSLNQHTRLTFVKPTVKEIKITTQILDAIFNYYTKECYCLAGYLNNSDQFWKVNYHLDLMKYHMCMSNLRIGKPFYNFF